ncbi:MAG: substrate-binding domain-containing protein [Acidimicrobiales bacterium]
MTAIVVAAALAACSGGDGDNNGAASSEGGGAGPEAGGGPATVHTVAGLEPLAREIVDTYNESSDAPIELAVEPPDQAIQAASQGSSVILPGPGLANVDAESTVIGRTLAIIVVLAGNPANVTGVNAFSQTSGLDTALCGPNASIGNFAALVVARGGVQPDPADVAEGCETDAVASVASGELDAALVFRSYVAIPQGVEVVPIPDDQNIVVEIRYAPASDNPSSGSFEAFLASDPAKQVLSRQGFLP